MCEKEHMPTGWSLEDQIGHPKKTKKQPIDLPGVRVGEASAASPRGQEPRPELLLATPPPAYSDDLVDTVWAASACGERACGVNRGDGMRWIQVLI